jgi:aldose 1-epimerase
VSAAPTEIPAPAVFGLKAGPMRALVRAGDGGRIAALWREDPKGRRTDVFVPMADGPYDPPAWPKAGCYPLVPWSNRIRGAAFRFGGREVRLPPHPASVPHAVHGFAQTRPWRVASAAEASLEMHYDHAPDAWPWAFSAVQRLSLDMAGLTLDIAVTNRSAEPMPCGLGVHPFIAVSPGDRIRFTAGVAWAQDDAGCGTQARALDPAESRHDRPHDATAVSDYRAGFDGMASIARGDGTRVVIETGAPFDHLVFHVPAGGAYACLEPVTHVADAFNLAERGIEGSGMRVLAPGQTLAGLVRIGLA